MADRLVLAAMGTQYGSHGSPLEYSGPVYKSMAVEGSGIRVKMDHTGGGLVARGGPLATFAIAGADRKFHWAKAAIDGDSIVVQSDEVPAPVAVRYAFFADPKAANLYNAAGLPASPFRTDAWELPK